MANSSKPIALVTGGSRGIGAAICEKLAAQGFFVIVNFSRSAEKAQNLANKIGGAVVQADVSDDEQVRAMFKLIGDKYGQLDALVTSAGIAILDEIQSLKRDDFEKTINTNLWGTMNCVTCAVPLMKNGVVVCISSICARTANPDAIIYSASKAAVESFVMSTAKGLAPDIRVNAVAPGATLTDMTIETYGGHESLTQWCKEKYPLQEVIAPTDIANAVGFLCSDASRMMTGQILTVDGGRTLE